MVFLSIFFKTFLKPEESFKQLIETERKNILALYFLLLPITGYTAMYICLTIAGGAPSVFTQWLNIPKLEYYFWNRLLLAPSMILCWLAGSGIIHLVCRRTVGETRFDDLLATIALATAVSMTFGLMHDLPMSIASALGIIDAKQHEMAMNSPTLWRTILWIFYALYTIAFITLFSRAAKFIYHVTTARAYLAGVTGFLFFQIVFLVFNR